MTRFDACLPLVLASEGGYSDRTDDKGGPTNFGITQATLTDWLMRPATVADVKALTAQTVSRIYLVKYWGAAHCDVLPPGVDYMVFDLAVNSGVNRACRYLQRAVGVTEDGVIGPKTLAAVAEYPALGIIKRMAQAREAFYRGLPDFPENGHGWLNRLAGSTLEFCIKPKSLKRVQGLAHTKSLSLPFLVKTGELVLELLEL